MNFYALLAALSLLATACTTARPEQVVPAAAAPAGSGPAATQPKPEPAGRWDAQRRRGVDFVASGSEPFWSLELTSQGQMRFRTVAGADSLVVPLPAPDQAADAPVLRYRSRTAAGTLTVTIAPRPCPNSMSGEVLPYTVAVQAQTTAQPVARAFAGCGRYLGDYRLHDIWALESLDGQAVDPAQFAKDKPYLELNLTREEVLGFAGCNGFGGSLTPERSGLKFGPLNGTMLACPALPFERKYLGALSGNAFTYRLENRRLTLENRVNRLVFKKID